MLLCTWCIHCSLKFSICLQESNPNFPIRLVKELKLHLCMYSKHSAAHQMLRSILRAARHLQEAPSRVFQDQGEFRRSTAKPPIKCLASWRPATSHCKWQSLIRGKQPCRMAWHFSVYQAFSCMYSRPKGHRHLTHPPAQLPDALTHSKSPLYLQLLHHSSSWCGIVMHISFHYWPPGAPILPEFLFPDPNTLHLFLATTHQQFLLCQQMVQTQSRILQETMYSSYSCSTPQKIMRTVGVFYGFSLSHSLSFKLPQKPAAASNVPYVPAADATTDKSLLQEVVSAAAWANIEMLKILGVAPTGDQIKHKNYLLLHKQIFAIQSMALSIPVDARLWHGHGLQSATSNILAA